MFTPSRAFYTPKGSPGRPHRWRRRSSVALSVFAAALLATAGCDEGRDTAKAAPTPQASAFDGEYIVAFRWGGQQAAIGAFVVAHGAFDVDLVNILGKRITGNGTVADDGVIDFTALDHEDGQPITAEGRFVGDSVEGTFDVEATPGDFAGSRDNVATVPPSAEYDGSYEVAFVRNDVERAVAVMQIRDGRFAVSITNIDDARFQVYGFVTSDGTVVIDGDGDADAEAEASVRILAEATIDQETREVLGIYRIGDLTGVVRGKSSD